ncbi:SDR family oxidoreductase [Rhodopseudomonas sp. HC1]|uniref:SDR family oxidoreductase n=1 Tax=Rhodopseudomonas infernalis TaxID=2897386 RepID=UPI001EE96776|nr:SDR family oxidoreductase [Rhodopseudomonas infernalis]MCG6204628.1 SDR family oxidoreductase [Rhodopseudomonas infernalis]
MKILVFGATGLTGRHLVAQAAARGWTVYAAGRDAQRLRELGGVADSSVLDLGDAAAVAEVVGRVAPDLIVSSVGGALPDGRLVDEAGNDAISDAAAGCGVRRLVQVSSLACGDSRPFASERIIAAIGPVLEAKTRAEDHLRALDLDWTIIRPGGLTDGAPTGSGALYADPRVHGRIARADLAELVLRVAASPATARLILSAVDRTTLPAEPADIREFADA